jgi:hypothetical protein
MAGSRKPPRRARRRPPKRMGAKAKRRPRGGMAVARVTAEDLRALRRELERRATPAAAGRRSGNPSGRRSTAAARWNPAPEDVQRSVAQLVLTLVEFVRRLMERQAVRRMEAQTLTPDEVEAVGRALMQLEETIRDIGARFGLAPEDLNLDLGPVRLM